MKHLKQTGLAALLAILVAAAPAPGDPYLLETCPVTGAKLGSMGDPVIKDYDGREVRFCCKACIPKFESDRAAYLKKIDEGVVQQQLSLYPLDTCLVGGSKLGSMGAPINHVYRNRLVRFCCKGCLPKFEASPLSYLAKLDKAVIERQAKSYRLDTCVVTGAKLGSMGSPVDHVFGNRLVRFCCKGCIGKFRKDPLNYLAKMGGTKLHQKSPVAPSNPRCGSGCCP